MEFFTIGVYNSTEKEFFEKLLKNKVDTFCDIRQRRGVRGAKYSFVNSNRLQERLSELDIKYGYNYNGNEGWRSIPYVGFDEPVNLIPAGTLVRVSLARWLDT